MRYVIPSQEIQMWLACLLACWKAWEWKRRNEMVEKGCIKELMYVCMIGSQLHAVFSNSRCKFSTPYKIDIYIYIYIPFIPSLWPLGAALLSSSYIFIHLHTSTYHTYNTFFDTNLAIHFFQLFKLSLLISFSSFCLHHEVLQIPCRCNAPYFCPRSTNEWADRY